MGKWAARLAEKTAAPFHVGTDKTAKRGLVSVLAVTPEGGAREIRAAPMLASKAADKPEALDLAAVACTDADIARFLDRRVWLLAQSGQPSIDSAETQPWADADISRFIARRDRLLRWGWPEPQAEALADRLTRRDVAGDDDRVSCADCQHYWPGRCGNHRRAGLNVADVGRDLVRQLQRCDGFKATDWQS